MTKSLQSPSASQSGIKSMSPWSPVKKRKETDDDQRRGSGKEGEDGSRGKCQQDDVYHVVSPAFFSKNAKERKTADAGWA